MTDVTLRQLRYFNALARHGHFGRAAEACAITQPALSMQIKELEESLGSVLLERNARKVALTKFGEEAASRVRDILRSVDELGDFARASQGRLVGRLRIGKDSGITIVRFNDVYLVEESEIALVKKELHENLNRPNLRVLLDCKNVRRLSTTAVAMIDELNTWMRPWGSSLALCRVRAELRDILTQLSLHYPIPHFTDKQVAMSSKW